jgi:hypothetical protein
MRQFNIAYTGYYNRRHRYSGLKQLLIGERFGGVDEGLVSRDRRAIREKIATEPKIRKWFQDIARLTT